MTEPRAWFAPEAQVLCLGASAESAVQRVRALFPDSEGAPVLVGHAWHDLPRLPLPESATYLWLDDPGGAQAAPAEGLLLEWLRHPRVETAALYWHRGDECDPSVWSQWLADAERRIEQIVAPVPIGGIAVLTRHAGIPDEAARAALAAQNRAAWSEWRVAALEASLAQAAERAGALEAEAAVLRRQARENDRRYREVEQRYRNLIGSERWRLANEIAEALKHPGRRTLRLPLEIGRGLLRFARPQLRRAANRLAYRLAGWRVRGAPAALPLLATAPQSARVELGRLILRTPSAPLDAIPAGLTRIDLRTGTAHRLSPNDWEYQLRRPRHSAVLIRAAEGFDDSAWRGAWAGLGDPRADGLLRLLAHCRNARIPLCIWVADDAIGQVLSTGLARHATHLLGEAQTVQRLVRARPELRSRMRTEIPETPAAWARLLRQS